MLYRRCRDVRNCFQSVQDVLDFFPAENLIHRVFRILEEPDGCPVVGGFLERDADDPVFLNLVDFGAREGYGHPHQVVLNRLAGTEVFRTDLQGTILCVSDGTNIRFSVEKETQENLYAAPATAAPESTGV